MSEFFVFLVIIQLLYLQKKVFVDIRNIPYTVIFPSSLSVLLFYLTSLCDY